MPRRSLPRTRARTPTCLHVLRHFKFRPDVASNTLSVHRTLDHQDRLLRCHAAFVGPGIRTAGRTRTCLHTHVMMRHLKIRPDVASTTRLQFADAHWTTRMNAFDRRVRCREITWDTPARTHTCAPFKGVRRDGLWHRPHAPAVRKHWTLWLPRCR
jgi:hypothetical protein